MLRGLAAFGSSARVTVRLLLRRQLRLPRRYVGRRLTFADGSRSRVFRETTRTGASTPDPAVLVVQFRLRLVRQNRVLHALFRAESIMNTPLFAGFPGFRSKLWLSDDRTRVYRGFYQWDGPDRATSYAATLSALLRLVCLPGSVAFHVEPGAWRDELLRAPARVGGPGDAARDQWWRPRNGAPAW